MDSVFYAQLTCKREVCLPIYLAKPRISAVLAIFLHLHNLCFISFIPTEVLQLSYIPSVGGEKRLKNIHTWKEWRPWNILPPPGVMQISPCENSIRMCGPENRNNAFQKFWPLMRLSLAVFSCFGESFLDIMMRIISRLFMPRLIDSLLHSPCCCVSLSLIILIWSTLGFVWISLYTDSRLEICKGLCNQVCLILQGIPRLCCKNAPIRFQKLNELCGLQKKRYLLLSVGESQRL